MKKFVTITAASVVGFALLRHFGPSLRDRAMAKCQEMMASHRDVSDEVTELASHPV